jgi:transcriptional regulatory protein RtcR
VHITTGTHVQQICLFLLTEARYLPGKLLQTSPPTPANSGEPGELRVIDLDLASYRQIAERVQAARSEGLSFLKAGIATRNAGFNALIEQIERVATATRSPILLTGPTGAGKTRSPEGSSSSSRPATRSRRPLRRAQLRHPARRRGDVGHVRPHPRRLHRGGARAARRAAQRRRRRALPRRDRRARPRRAGDAAARARGHAFLPVGSDREVSSDFQLIAGTNRDLRAAVRAGRFRDDLLARIDLWTFRMPSLRERPEDIEPNLDYELERYAQRHGRRVTFGRTARAQFLRFAVGPDARWPGNFRDFAAAIERMATLAPGAQISGAEVDAELSRLQAAWSEGQVDDDDALLRRFLGPEVAELDRFDRVQLADVLRVCHEARSLSDAGRLLFAASRERRSSHNDADRLRKYLQKFAITWTDLQDPPGA